MEAPNKSEDNGKKSKSLTDITNAFNNFMKSQNGNEVDITQVEKALDISKRRLYDVINVLSGVGVVERSGKSKIKWIEEPNMNQEKTEEEPSIQQLQEYEQSIDAKIEEVSNSFSQFFSSPENKQFFYIPINCFNIMSDHNPNASRFVLSGPSDLQIEISDDLNENNFLKIVGTSNSGTAKIIPISDTNL